MAKEGITRAEILALDKHMDGLAPPLDGNEVALLRSLSAKSGQKPYRKPVLRGFDAPESAMDGIIRNRPFKLSTFAGAKKLVESWTTDPDTAMFFAAGPGLPIILRARPSPRDIAIFVNEELSDMVMERAKELDMPVKSWRHIRNNRSECEVVVATGNRKYTLCRNIVYMKMHGRDIPFYGRADILADMIPDRKNADLFREAAKEKKSGTGTYFHFACADGKLAYIPDYSAKRKWMARIRGA